MTATDSFPTARLLSDPVLRRWLLLRLRGQEKPARPRAEPRLAPLPGEPPHPLPYPEHPLSRADRPQWLHLPGGARHLTPADIPALFDKDAQEPLNGPALHSFCWLEETDITPGWNGSLTQEWLRRYGDQPFTHAGWDPLVTSWRAIQLVAALRQGRLPGGSSQLGDFLVRHLERLRVPQASACVPPLLQGAALVQLGLALGLKGTVEIALNLLQAVGGSLRTGSGMTAQGSTHLHLLQAVALAECWLSAQDNPAAQDSAAVLGGLTAPLLAVLPALTLPGGLPLTGRVLPFGPRQLGDWLDRLAEPDRSRMTALQERNSLTDLEKLRRDGWLRASFGRWAGLWRAEPGGWPPPCSFSHQDLGSFEIHYGDVPVFVDPGEGDGRAPELMDAAAGHNSLLLNGADPYPDPYPFYSDSFRRDLCGPPPQLRVEHNGVSLRFTSYGWLGGPKEAFRRWFLDDDSLRIEDYLPGTGRFDVTRRLITPFDAVQEEGGSVLLSGPGDLRFRLSAEGGTIVLGDGMRTLPEGGVTRVTVIDILSPKCNLPWLSNLSLRRLAG